MQVDSKSWRSRCAQPWRWMLSKRCASQYPKQWLARARCCGPRISREPEVPVRSLRTPGLTPRLAEAAATVSYPLLPGVASASEILQALQLGYDTLKFFPSQQVGG